jgi:hypothetical protein
MSRVLVVMMYMFAPSEGSLTLDFILFESVKFRAALTRLLLFNRKESISFVSIFSFNFFR